MAANPAVSDLVILLVMLVLSGFFSGSETAMTALSRIRAENLAKEGRPGAAALWKLKQTPNRMLIILLIGNNVVNIGASAMATVIATERLGRLGPSVAVGCLTLAILIFGEVTPKSFAIRNAERMSLVAAPIIAMVGTVLRPFVWALEHFIRRLQRGDSGSSVRVTETDLIALVAHGAATGTINRQEREIIERVFAFDDLRVQDVMTPRHQVFAIQGSRTLREVVTEVVGQSHSRIPVYGDGPDDIKKVLYLRDVLAASAEDKLDIPVLDLARDALFVPETRTLTQLFSTLRAKSLHIAVVVDEYGSFEGVVTMEDLLEELVGEIYDETDLRDELLREEEPGVVLVDGAAEVRVVGDYFALDTLSGKPTDTVSLWVLNLTERIPSTGEVLDLDGLEVTVDEATRRRIRRLRIRRSEPTAAS